jgi:intraflagellar transport protein 172
LAVVEHHNENFQPEQHEEMKEWVLAISVDKQIEKRLIVDERGCYEASLVAPDGSVSQPCIVTGKKNTFRLR